MVKLHVFRTTLLLLTVLAYGFISVNPQEFTPKWIDRSIAASQSLQSRAETLFQQLSEQTCTTIEGLSIVLEPFKWWAEILAKQKADSS